MTMRRLVKAGLEVDPRIRVVAEAACAREARDIIMKTRIDGMTLDVEMPGMNGLDFLRRLMTSRPMPVVMLSSMTAEGSEAAVRALALGAMECVEKPRFGAAGDTFERLRSLFLAVDHCVSSDRNGRMTDISDGHGSATNKEWNGKIILLGASTGGVEAIEKILKDFPRNCAPTYIIQHMPAQFLASFAARLDRIVAPRVRLAENGDEPERGRVLIAPGGAHHLTFRPGKRMFLELTASEKVNGHRPSIDMAFCSAVENADRVIAALLTGMGRDGARGVLLLSHGGATCLAQDAASCVVHGMPRAAVELGGVHSEVPLGSIARKLIELTTGPYVDAPVDSA